MTGIGKNGAAFLVAAALITHSLAARAETDLTKITCGEFSDIMLSKDPQMEVGGALIIGFLWGLFKGDDEAMVIGNAADTKKLGKLASFCKANPNANLMAAADKTMDQD